MLRLQANKKEDNFCPGVLGTGIKDNKKLSVPRGIIMLLRNFPLNKNITMFDVFLRGIILLFHIYFILGKSSQ